LQIHVYFSFVLDTSILPDERDRFVSRAQKKAFLALSNRYFPEATCYNDLKRSVISMLTIALLGPTQISYNQQTDYKIRSSNAQALLVYLAVEGAADHTSLRRETLMALLWPDTLPQSAQTNLRQAIYQLRQAIPSVTNLRGEEIPFINANRQTVSLNPEGNFELDVDAFLHLALRPELTQQVQAVDLYRGDFLADFSLPSSNPFELWAEQWRERLRRIMLGTLTSLADHAQHQGNYTAAEQYARRQMNIDPLREEAHHQLITALALSRRGHEAITHFESYCQLLQTELDLPPAHEITVLVEKIREGDIEELGGSVSGIPPSNTARASALKAVFAAQKTEPSPGIPNNLPTQSVPFIGRQAELKTLNELLSKSQTRLITITGPGGIGKTRLSLAAAESQLALNTFNEGVFFIPLAGLNEHERIAPAIAEAIQFRLEQDESQLLAYLRNKQLLLVLDNFEHLMKGNSLIKRILQTAPQVYILVTSRERLRLQEEQVYPIYGFPVDNEAGMEDARQLFFQTARRIRPDFEQTSDNIGTLNQICRLVDGMPLALELAAAWVDTLSPADIAVEIRRGLDILETNLQDMPDRHRSMQAVFDTSWQNLSEDTQNILAQLSVFRGGFTREAAQSVAKASLHDLAVLVNKSLLIFDPTSERYAIHELLRQYSAARLSQSDVRDRYCTYYSNWLIQQGEKLNGTEQEAAVRQIEKDIDNILTALNQTLEDQNRKNLDQVIRYLGLYFNIQGYDQEGLNQFNQIWQQLINAAESTTRSLYWALIYKVRFSNILGRYPEVLQFWPHCQTLLADLAAENEDIRAEQAIHYSQEGYRLYFPQPVKAKKLFQQSYEVHKELNELWLAGYALLSKARAARNLGDFVDAEATTTAGLKIFQALNNRKGIGDAQLLLGYLAGLGGHFSEAEHWLQEGIATARTLNNALRLANDGLNKLGMVYYFSGRFKEAMVPNAEYRLLSEEYGYTFGITQHNIALGLLYLHRGLYTEALEQGKEGFALASENKNHVLVCEALILLAQAQMALGDIETARTHMQGSEEQFSARSVGTALYVAGSDFYWGILDVLTGQLDSARTHLLTELSGSVNRKANLNLANALAGIALLKAKEGDITTAIELYALAQRHPFVANSHWFADMVGQHIEQSAGSLAAEDVQAARERGEKLDLWETAKRLL